MPIVNHYIVDILNKINSKNPVKYLITYQSPSYAIVLKNIIKWCKKREVKYIVNCADITIFDSQPIMRRIIMNLNWKYLHSITYKNAKGIIAVSTYIEKFYHLNDRPSIIVPPLYIETRSERKKGKTENKRDDRVTFVYAGTPFPLLKHRVNPAGMKDRLDKIIEMFSELENMDILFNFIIVGLEIQDYCYAVPEHKKYVKQSKNIFFLGRKSHEETLNIVENADFMINYRDENTMNKAGLSTKIVESISLGTPVIMNEIGDTFHYLEKGKTGFVLSGNKKKDLELIKNLCSTSCIYRGGLKQYCRKKNPFVMEDYIAKFSTFFEEVDHYSSDSPR